MFDLKNVIATRQNRRQETTQKPKILSLSRASKMGYSVCIGPDRTELVLYRAELKRSGLKTNSNLVIQARPA